MKNNSGFTLIELVIVVVILGFLAVTAIPKFIDLTDQAKQANIEGMAGGFATGVLLARAQWEAEARPTTGNKNTVDYDGTMVLLTTQNTASGIRGGYIVSSIPSGGTGDGDLLDSDFDVSNCLDIWNSILEQPPRATTSITTLNNDTRTNYYVAKTGTGSSTLCHYYLKETLDKNTDNEFITPVAPTDGAITDIGNNFTYRPATSEVVIFINP